MRGTTTLLLMLLVLLPRVAAAEDGDAVGDCFDGYAWAPDSCYEIPADCAKFCTQILPCVGTTYQSCGGGGVIGPGEGDTWIIDSWEACETVEVDLEAVKADCLGDCVWSFNETGENGWMGKLIECMEEAQYECDAWDVCMDEVYSSWADYDWYGDVEGWVDDLGGEGGGPIADVVSGEDVAVGIPEVMGEEDGPGGGGGEDTSPTAEPGSGSGGDASCAAIGEPGSTQFWVLLFLLAVVVGRLVRADRGSLLG